MSVDGIRRRLDRLARENALSEFDSIASTLDRVANAAKARRERGEPEPALVLDPPPENGRRAREGWRRLAHAHARHAFLLAGRFDELKAAYTMSDAELWRTLAQEQVTCTH
jgi:hypothetical protein